MTIVTKTRRFAFSGAGCVENGRYLGCGQGTIKDLDFVDQSLKERSLTGTCPDSEGHVASSRCSAAIVDRTKRRRWRFDAIDEEHELLRRVRIGTVINDDDMLPSAWNDHRVVRDISSQSGAIIDLTQQPSVSVLVY